jgi:hypothetical protein
MSEHMRTAKAARVQPPSTLTVNRGQVTGPEIDDLGVTLTVHMDTSREGQWCIQSIEVSHPDGVTGALLRKLPLAQIERQERNLQAQKVAEMDEAFRIHNERDPVARLQRMLAKLPDASARRSMPDEFYELVADAYMLHVRNVTAALPTPSLIISKVTGTPLPTVQGWVRRARLRGYLPPARRGKAG